MESISLLSESECAEVRDTVHRMRDLWLPRKEGVPYFTLGAASYLDLKDDPSGKLYEERAKTYNSIITKELAWFYERVFQQLQAKLQSDIYPAEKFAVPGFLIFLAHPYFQRSDLAFRHFDLPYELLNWADRNQLDVSDPLSFTLAISLPKNGGGMYTWDIPYSKDQSPEVFLAMADRSEKTLYRYSIGSMILHSGHHLHQIAPFFNLQPEDERITLQGHLIRYAGKWVYYL